MNGTAFSLEFHCEGEKIFVRGNERVGREHPTLRHVESLFISLSAARKKAGYISGLVSQAVARGSLGKNDLDHLKEEGQSLFDDLLPPDIKARLCKNGCRSLTLGLDDNLVGIPWELLFDGKEFLPLRFNMGRVVSTRHTFHGARRKVSIPLRMLLLADPQGNLAASYTEGIRLREMLDERMDLVKVSFKSSEITADYVARKLRLFDMVHYAGHADYDADDPASSGFLLADDRLAARTIKDMAGWAAFPSFVFLNGCHSGRTREWRVNGGYEKVYGLANAFLLAGVRHYLGTFWEIQDEPGSLFAQEFYRNLLDGAMIGEAVRKARVRLINELGEENIIWASYMLYGDPAFQYIRAEEETPRPAPSESPRIPTAHAIASTMSPRRGTKKIVSLANSVSSSWIVPTLLCTVLTLFLFTLFLLAKSHRSDLQPETPTTRAAPQTDNGELYFKRAERIDKQIEDLARKFREGSITPAAEPPRRESSPLSIVFLDIAGDGISGTESKLILGRLIAELKKSPRVRIVERAVLDKLLDELRLSASELADRSTSLRLGRVLSARLLTEGIILRRNHKWLVDFKIYDTESTLVVAAISLDETTEDISALGRLLSDKILNGIRESFPLQGLVETVADTMATISVLSESGAREGMAFDVLSEKGLVVGSLKVVSVQQGRTSAIVISGAGDIVAGLRVREFVESR